MIKWQKEPKLAGSIFLLLVMTLVFSCFMTGCQPTPENPVVENKGDGELEAAILQTAPSITDASQESTPQDTADPSQELRITQTRTNDAGTITVNIDAKVVLPGDEKITIARLERMKSDYFTQEDVEKAVRVFFGDSPDNLTFYDPNVTTKADIEAGILELQQRMTDEEAMLNCDYAKEEGITDIEAIKAHINELIEKRMELWRKAPEYPPVISDLDIQSCLGTGRSFKALVDFGEEYMGSVGWTEPSSRNSPGIGLTAFGGDYPKEGRTLDFTDIQVDVNANDPELAVAKQAAQSFIEDMGIEGVRIGDVFSTPDKIRSDTPNLFGEFDKITVSDREFYVFCFERIVGERTIDFTFYNGASSGDDEVSNTLPYEVLEVWVEGDSVVAFNWSGPHRVKEIINDNAALQVNYEQALNTIVNQIHMNYAYAVESGEAEFITVDITGIEFEMVRVKEKNSDYYISVPAWKIYGDMQEKLTEERKNEFKESMERLAEDPYQEIPEDYVIPDYISLNTWNGPNIFSVNALDGSIIDMEKGY